MSDTARSSVRLVTLANDSAMDDTADAARVLLVGADGVPYSAGGAAGLTDAELRATPVPVSGTVEVSEPVTVDGTVALDALSLAALETVSVANFPPTQPVSAAALPLPAGAATEATLAAIQTLVDGLASLAETQPVSLVSVPSHAVTGPVTDAQLRATPVPVSGTVSVTEPVTVDGTVALDSASLSALETISVGNFPATQPVSIAAVALDAGTLSALETVTANPATGQGKTLLFGTITQGAAGTTQLVAADVGAKIKLVSYVVVMDAAGSFKFSDGVADLSGVIPIAANGGVSAVGQPSAHLLETAAINRALSIVTVTGKAFGHFSYIKEA